MFETRGSTIALHLGAVYALGAVVLSVALNVLPMFFFAGMSAAAIVLAVTGILAFSGLSLVIGATRSVSWWGATLPRRMVWAAMVFGFGTALLGLGWIIVKETGPLPVSDRTLALLAGGIPFMLVAGVLLRGWYVRLPAAVALLAVVGTGLVAVRESGPDELTRRLEHARLDRATAYVVEIPGYRPTENAYGARLGAGGFLPADPAAVPQPRYVSIVAYRTVVPEGGACGETALDSDLMSAECTVEPGGMVYRRGVVRHGYQVRGGEAAVVVAGNLAVDRELLRGAASSVRPATATDLPAAVDIGGLFVADLPGYRGQPTGIPRGMLYEPADHAHGERSVAVFLRVDRATPGQDCLAAECTPEGDGLTYVRRADSHGYAGRRGAVTVHVTGGVLVDRALLRQAVLAARPATEAELLRALPPVPPRGVVDRMRSWLRAHT